MRPIVQLPPTSQIDSIEPATPSPTKSQQTAGVSFESLLGDMVGKANEMDASARIKSAALAAGATDDIHGTMIAVKEAEISLKLVGSIRNKLLDAFHEIWRTGV